MCCVNQGNQQIVHDGDGSVVKRMYLFGNVIG